MLEETQSATRVLLILLATILTASCASSGGVDRSTEEIVIAYDPARESAADAMSQAQSQCAAFGATAEFIDETIDPDGRLRHRRFKCR